VKRNEKILAALLVAVLVFAGGNWFFERALNSPLAARRQKIAELRDEIARKELLVRHARRAGARLAEWEARALPSNTEVARSLYQNWLVQLVARAELDQPNVDSGEAVKKQGIYERLSFTIRGRGSLEQLIYFLYEFYRADHLHQVVRLGITPIANSPRLDLSLGIEALVLPGADRKERLAGGRSTRLAHPTLAEYRLIVDRNVFGNGGASPFDAADYTFLTAIVDSDGQPEAWLTVRTTAQVMKLHVGESFEVGQFRGTVVDIAELDVVLDSDDERWLLTLGENLTQATALPPEQ